MLPILERKLIRELRRLAGQAAAIVFVVGCAVATAVMAFGVLRSLEHARTEYYERGRFAHLFVSLERAPEAAAQAIRRLPGVAAVQTRLVMDAVVRRADTEEAIAARLLSLPEHREPEVNAIVLREGRTLRASDDSEVVVSERFAAAHGLGLGERLSVLAGGHRRELIVVGVALSPEYIYALGPGMIAPDDRRFGVLWIGRRLLETALDASGVFNELSIRVQASASIDDLSRQIETLLAPYGAADIHGRDRQPSHAFVSAMFHQIAGVGRIAPAIFLLVAAFLVHTVLGRLIETQRQHIGLFKALGISDAQIGRHYFELVAILGGIGIALGLAAGTMLGQGLIRLYAELFHFPVLQFEHDPWSVLAVCAVSIGAMAAGALRSLRAVNRLSPAVALAPPAPPGYGRTGLDRLAPRGAAGGAMKMVLRQLGRFPQRAMLTLGGLALAVALQTSMLFSFDALDRMIEFHARAETRDFAVLFARPLPIVTAEALARSPGVLRAEGWRMVPARLTSGSASRVVNVTGLARSAVLRTLLDAELTPVSAPRQGLALPRKLAALLRVEVGDSVTFEPIGSHAKVELPVTRVIEQYIGLDAYMALDALNALMPGGPATNGADVVVDPQRRAEFMRNLPDNGAVAGVSERAAVLASFRNTMLRTLTLIVSFFVAFAGLVAFGIAYSGARIALSEREREFAILASLGFDARELGRVLVLETAILLALALPLGSLLGHALAWVIVQRLDTELYRVPLVVGASTVAISVLVVATAAMLSTLSVARHLRRMNLPAVLNARQ